MSSKIRKVILLFFLTACLSSGPEPIAFNFDKCAHCHMVISDKRFGGEIKTEKGKAYKFDSIDCILEYKKQNTQLIHDSDQVYVLDLNEPELLIKVQEAYFVDAIEFKSPMGAPRVASKTKDKLLSVTKRKEEDLLRWNQL